MRSIHVKQHCFYHRLVGREWFTDVFSVKCVLLQVEKSCQNDIVIE